MTLSLPTRSGLIAFAALTAGSVTARAVDFGRDIAPILRSHCVECHGNGKSRGDFSLDTRDSILAAVKPNDPAKSELIRRVTSTDADTRMPPKGNPLTVAQTDSLKAWIAEGAAWPPGFTFKAPAYVAPLKPRRPSLPPGSAGDGTIDRFVAAYYAKHGVTPPAQLGDAEFARRASLDLIGLIPTPDELAAFLADRGPDARGRFVRKLLADRRAYADHWLSFWNDLLRNDYVGTGFIDAGRKQISAWLYQSLTENKPYDQFARELIAPTAESEGFLKGIKWRGRVNASQVPELQFAQNVSQVFFGVNMKCASCHDSFVDRWTLADAYGLAAVAAEKPLEVHRCDVATGKTAAPRFLWPELGGIDPNLSVSGRLERLAALATHPDNGRFARTMVNRVWHRLMGRGFVHPVDAMDSEPWSQNLLDALAVEFADDGYDLKRLMERIAASRAYQSRAAARPEHDGEYVFRGPEAKRLTAEQFVDAVWQTTGTGPDKPHPKGVPVRVLAAAGPNRGFVRAALVASDPVMRSLGRPNREQVVTSRSEVLTTLQALDLTTGEGLADLVARGADKFLAKPGTTPDDVAEAVFLRTLCRRPTADELASARGLVGDPPTPDGVADLLWVTFMLPEFQLVR